jgi:hypothetical protein
LLSEPYVQRHILPPDGDPAWPGIFIRAKLNGDHWLDYEIWEVTGLEIDGNPYISKPSNSSIQADLTKEEDLLLSGFIKWDGCMQWSPNHDGTCTWFHADDRLQARGILCLIVDTIYELARELIPAWHED